MQQQILSPRENYLEVDEYLKKQNIKTALLVCDNSFPLLEIYSYFKTIKERLGISVIKFDDFHSNPTYESVERGVRCFHEKECELIIAVGGGSAIDVAKCIKLYSNMEPEENYLQQKIIPNEIELLAIPTTAGTGSEATRYAVIYYNGEKQSVTDNSCIPKTVLLDSSVLKTLPDYQRKVTMMDALCHSIESFWSVNSTEESKKYSKEAIQKILTYYKSYLNNEEIGNQNMLYAANIAGKAINITQTTAGHAMSYKLTSLYGIAHGHAVALCMTALWTYMIAHVKDACIDERGSEYMEKMFAELAETMGCRTAEKAAEKFSGMVKEMQFAVPVSRQEDFQNLVDSVNIVRLSNNPIRLGKAELAMLYHQILGN